MITRRGLVLASIISPTTFLGYASAIEPMFTTITRYRVSPKTWPSEFRLKIAVIADIHACEPWMSAERIAGIVETTNRLDADIVVLLGDYVAGHDFISSIVPNEEWAAALSGLRAPLGVYAVLGNHDWWRDLVAQRRGSGPTSAGLALENVGIPVLENEALRVSKGGQTFWIAGLGDQIAIRGDLGSHGPTHGVHDLEATLSMVDDSSPVILLAHEPDIFLRVPSRVTLTLSGHTHGGQVRLFGLPIPSISDIARKYIYGHYSDGDRHLVVSGGLGCSKAPMRIGVPPEILLIDVG